MQRTYITKEDSYVEIIDNEIIVNNDQIEYEESISLIDEDKI